MTNVTPAAPTQIRILVFLAKTEGKDVRTFLREALAKYDSIERTAEKLGVARTTLTRELRIHGISPALYNKASTVLVNGLEATVREHCERNNNGVNPDLARTRMSLGWSPEEALMTPPFVKRGTQRESELEAYLAEYVRDCGGETRKVGWVGRKNAPDRLVMLNGSCVWVELKRPGISRADPAQAREHERMRRCGGCDVRLVNSRLDVDMLVEEMLRD